ncbi:MAG: Exodeoxyribonuclease 10 [Lentisphaerae bacterium ADurb.BinA184]|nr:MAG: Exodeoxyribonuclease 10 [Lentisphaerae bacterium ADurb.BinA184]
MMARTAALTVIDFETTGRVEGFPNQPWQIGLAQIRDGHVRPDFQFESLLRVGQRPFNPYAPGRHALLRAEIAAAPSLDTLWPALRPWLLGAALVAHNVSGEKHCLADAFPLHRLGPWIDTLALVRVAFPDLRSHQLEDVLPALGLDAKARQLCPGRQPHDALYDAIGCACLLDFLLHLPGWENASVEALSRARPAAFLHRRRRPG